ncbi:phosphotransferase [Streptomyces sp. NPDC051001]|uniref:phosphotransferase n=1 Tax=Streptomyces sp. NPDC051001 TaxID=3155795 RepID=UPI00342DE315
MASAASVRRAGCLELNDVSRQPSSGCGPGLSTGHHDAASWNVVWRDRGLAGFFDWDTARPSTREFDLAFMALTWFPCTYEGSPSGPASPPSRTVLGACACCSTPTDTRATACSSKLSWRSGPEPTRTSSAAWPLAATRSTRPWSRLPPTSIRRPAKSTCCPLPSGCPRIAATTTLCLTGSYAPPALTPRDPTATADTGRIEPLAGSPDPCHGRDTALLTVIRSTRRALPAHRRRRPPATRGPYRRTTQGGSGMVAACGIATAHAAQASASCQVRPQSARISTSCSEPRSRPGLEPVASRGRHGEGRRAAPRHRVHRSPLPARSRRGPQGGPDRARPEREVAQVGRSVSGRRHTQKMCN